MNSARSFCAAIIVVGVMTTSATSADRDFGEVPPGGFRSPEGDSRFTPESGVRPLNNLVFELLNVESPGNASHTIRNPREGWLYIRVRCPKAAAINPPVVMLDGAEVKLKVLGDHAEAMRFTAAGPHTVALASGAKAERLEVRAIGELFYAAYGSDPHIPEMGKYSWEYLREHCLVHYNSMIGSEAVNPDGTSVQEHELREWTSDGKRWFTLHPAPDNVRVTRPARTADEAFDYWTNTMGMRHPLMSGIFADEFGPKQSDFFPAWNEALRRIHADSQFKNRRFYAYTSNRYTLDGDQAIFPFFQTLMNCDYRLAPEWYLSEGRSRPGRVIEKTEDLQAELSPGWELSSRASFERANPGAASNRIIVVATLSEPGMETCDIYPQYDFNVWLDCQMQFIATDPAYFATRGLQGYLSSYCGEEQTRLFAQLIRHYGIEGRTERFLKDPYVLHHLKNPDFETGTSDWNLMPAVVSTDQPSMAVKKATGFGTLQAKYHAHEGAGDIALWTKRSSKAPNRISQKVQNLIPGRLYSLRFITGDFRELQEGKSNRRNHAISVKLGNTESVATKCFQAIFDNGAFYTFGPFNRNNPYCMNYHQQVFRATQETAEVTFSDWLSQSAADGPEDEELIWNFIQIQPYFE